MPSGLRARRNDDLGAEDVTARYGIPTTTATRTLFDVSSLLGDRALREALSKADRRGLLVVDALLGLCDRSRGRSGVARLRRGLAGFVAIDPRTVSPLENEFLDFARRYRLPAPAVNVEIGPYRVDFAWMDRRVVVETDGWDTHRIKPAFESDRERFGKLQRWGWRVLPVTAARLRRDARGLDADLRALLGLEPAR